MSPAAAKVTPAVEILMVATATGEEIKVVPPAKAAAAKTAKAKPAASKTASPKTPAKAKTAAKASGAKAAKSKAGAEAAAAADLDQAADQLLATADTPAAGDDTAAVAKDDDKAAKALASIKVGPKGVYTEDSIRVYLQEIGRIRLLRPDEEIELARKIADLLQLEEIAAQFESDNGRLPDTKEWAVLVDMPTIKFRRRLMLGRRAKEKMVQSNLRLVVSIAKKYMNRGLSFQDLIQEGSLGLIRAAEKFDHEKGYKFSTYATWWIRQAISRAIADKDRTIRIPGHTNALLRKVRQTAEQLQRSGLNDPSLSRIALEAELDVEAVTKSLLLTRKVSSLDKPAQGGDGPMLVEVLAAEQQDAYDHLHRLGTLDQVRHRLRCLSAQERLVVERRFLCALPPTLQEVGEELGISRDMVRALEKRAIRRLRQELRRAGHP